MLEIEKLKLRFNNEKKKNFERGIE